MFLLSNGSYIEKLQKYLNRTLQISGNENEFDVKVDWQSSFIIKKTFSCGQELYTIVYRERGTDRILESSSDIKRIEKSLAIKLKTVFSDRPMYENKKRFEKLESEKEMVELIRHTFNQRYFSIVHKEANKISIVHGNDNKYKLYLTMLDKREQVLAEKTKMKDAYLALYNYLIFYNYYSELVSQYELIFNNHKATDEEILDYLYFPTM
jgi:hypothetical protein